MTQEEEDRLRRELRRKAERLAADADQLDRNLYRPGDAPKEFADHPPHIQAMILELAARQMAYEYNGQRYIPWRARWPWISTSADRHSGRQPLLL